MDGFNLEQLYEGPTNGQYVYVPRSETKPYWDMAREFVLADHMHASQLDESFVAHQYIIAAQADSSVDVPGGPWGCEGGPNDRVQTLTHKRTYGPSQVPCFRYQTLGDELDGAGLPWRFYTSSYTRPLGGFWSGYQAVKHIFNGPDWKKDIVIPQKRFLRDIKAGKLTSFTWITPLCPDSDHLACGGGLGPSWVTSLVNAVGESKFWDSTAVFVQWDDWGGTYDPVPPPFKDYDSLGFPRSAHRDLCICEAELRLARAIRDGERFTLRGRLVRPSSPDSGRHPRDLSGGRLFRFLAEAAHVRSDQSAEGTGFLPAPSQRRSNPRRAMTIRRRPASQTAFGEGRTPSNGSTEF